VTFDLTYAGDVVGQQTCSFNATITDTGVITTAN